jgi:hypothetical protein
LKARTGEFTPPGKKRSARCCNACDLLRFRVSIGELIVPSVYSRTEVVDRPSHQAFAALASR